MKTKTKTNMANGSCCVLCNHTLQLVTLDEDFLHTHAFYKFGFICDICPYKGKRGESLMQCPNTEFCSFDVCLQCYETRANARDNNFAQLNQSPKNLKELKNINNDKNVSPNASIILNPEHTTKANNNIQEQNCFLDEKNNLRKNNKIEQLKNQNEGTISLSLQNEKEKNGFYNKNNENLILYTCPDCEDEEILVLYSKFEKEKNKKYHNNGFLCDICCEHLENEDLLHCENLDCEFDGCLSCLPNAKQTFPKCSQCTQYLCYHQCHKTKINQHANTFENGFICDECMKHYRDVSFLSCPDQNCNYDLCFECCHENEEIIKQKFKIAENNSHIKSIVVKK
jgi:hypothetical protein